jgi:uncharacterized secreted protein with C-terminal beta-propeller domain
VPPGTTPIFGYTGSYSASLYIPNPPPADCGGWAHFTSEAQLRERLTVLYPYPVMFEGDAVAGTAPPTSARSDSPTASGAESTSSPAPDYTGTNVQVAGVDEPDTVKTDGWYIYTVSQGGVTIARAYPPSQLAVVATISLPGQWPSGLFVSGDRLVVITSAYGAIYADGGMASREGGVSIMPYYYTPSTGLLVYDIADPANPTLASNISLTGYSVGARMIGYDIFLVATYWMYLYNDNITYPSLTIDGTTRTLAATDIGYFPEAHNSSSLTEVLVVNLTHPQDASLTALLADTGSTLYMSMDSLYLVGYGGFVAETGMWVDASTLHRLYIWKDKVACAVTGQVRGHVLNQYSLDEWGGHLRVATTEWGTFTANGTRLQTANHVFVLDGSLNLTGSIESLAPGETIQSVRFMGARAYVVTFRQIDPFFVIDLTDPKAPAVLGELKITGFSRYLHPVGTNLILGIGPAMSAPDANGRTQMLGLKLSLFDVADVAHPAEVSKYVIEGTYVYSEVEYDAHALLWVPSRHLLAIPVQIYESSATTTDGMSRPWYYWQGVYVFTVKDEAGIELVGRLSHQDASDSSVYYGTGYIRRALQIGEYLYTVSDTTIQANDLSTLEFVARLTIWTPTPYPGPEPLGGDGTASSPPKA